MRRPYLAALSLKDSMDMIQVIGAGFGRTGTSSLQAALEILLSGPCYHMKTVLLQDEHLQAWSDFAAGVLPAMDWKRLLHGYTAAVDFPVCIYYRELMAQFPDAKIILTIRDPLQWWNSFNRLQRLTNKARLLCFCVPRLRKIARFTDTVIIQSVFGGSLDRDCCIAVYNRHIAEVRSVVPRKQLLEFDVSQGWEPLCDFLKKPVPQVPFPHLYMGMAPLRRLFRQTLLRWLLRR